MKSRYLWRSENPLGHGNWSKKPKRICPPRGRLLVSCRTVQIARREWRRHARDDFRPNVTDHAPSRDVIGACTARSWLPLEQALATRKRPMSRRETARMSIEPHRWDFF